MYFRWMIGFLNILFVFSLGCVTLWLFYRSLTSNRVRMSSPKQRAELLLEVSRKGAPLLKISLNKSHYLIGRGPECDIPLKGLGIPFRTGEIYRDNGFYVFKNFRDNSVVINNEAFGKAERKLSVGDEIRLYDYSIRVKQKGTE